MFEFHRKGNFIKAVYYLAIQTFHKLWDKLKTVYYLMQIYPEFPFKYAMQNERAFLREWLWKHHDTLHSHEISLLAFILTLFFKITLIKNFLNDITNNTLILFLIKLCFLFKKFLKSWNKNIAILKTKIVTIHFNLFFLV